MADTQTKDQRLDDLAHEGDLQTLGLLVEGSPDGASAMALYLIACELRLIRRSIQDVISLDGCVYTRDGGK